MRGARPSCLVKMSKIQARQTSVVYSVTVPGGKSLRSSSRLLVAAMRAVLPQEMKSVPPAVAGGVISRVNPPATAGGTDLVTRWPPAFFHSDVIENTAPQTRADRTISLAFRHQTFDDRVSVSIFDHAKVSDRLAHAAQQLRFRFVVCRHRLLIRMPCDDRSDKTKVPLDWLKLKAKSDSTPHLRLSFMKQIKAVSNPGDFSGPK